MVRRSLASLVITVLGCALFVHSAQAVPLLWTLNDVTFDDGGTAFGTFVFDADTNTVSSVAVTTTAGTSLGGAIYSTGSVFGVGQGLLADDSTGGFDHDLRLVLDGAAMTNAGGTIPIFLTLGLSVETCQQGNFDCPGVSFRFPTGGTISAIPEPSTIVLVAGGLLVLVSLGRRRVG